MKPDYNTQEIANRIVQEALTLEDQARSADLVMLAYLLKMVGREASRYLYERPCPMEDGPWH